MKLISCLLSAAGAVNVDFPLKTACCGGAHTLSDSDTSTKLVLNRADSRVWLEPADVEKAYLEIEREYADQFGHRVHFHPLHGPGPLHPRALPGLSALGRLGLLLGADLGTSGFRLLGSGRRGGGGRVGAGREGDGHEEEEQRETRDPQVPAVVGGHCAPL